MDTPNIRRMREIERRLVEAEGPYLVETEEVLRLREELEEACEALTDEERNS